MTNPSLDSPFGPAVAVEPGAPGAEVIVVCEHAAHALPEALGDLGLGQDLRQSHIAWDPGALAVAKALADRLKAPLVHGLISRLVYDCNRPPQAPDAIPAQSERHAIPGNAGLSPEARAARVEGVYRPFERRLGAEIEARRGTVALMVTIHSFTPVYHGTPRAVELGLLHGRDARFATAMYQGCPKDFGFTVEMNQPYSAADGVAHTLDRHGAGLLSVMLEIRNDLLALPQDQHAWAARLAPWITETLATVREGAR